MSRKHFFPFLVLILCLAPLSGADRFDAACEHLSVACEELAALCCELEADCCLRFAPSRAGLYIFADYLWWKINQSGTEFAIDGVRTDREGKLFALNGEFAPGFRVGAGFRFPCTQWDLLVNWIHYRSSQSVFVEARSGLELLPTRTLPNGASRIESADAFWKVALDTIGIQLGYPIQTPGRVVLHPHAGIRIDWVDTSERVFYDGFGGSGPNPNSIFTCAGHYYGIGPEVGFAGNWQLFSCLMFFGDMRIATQWGMFRFHQVQDVLQVATNEDTNFRSAPNRNQSWISAEVGMRFERELPTGGRFSAQVSWEGMTMVTMGKAVIFTDESRDGAVVPVPVSLEVGGLCVRGEYAF